MKQAVEYDRRDYWVDRYKTREQPFEWYLVKIEHIEDLLHQYLDFSNVLYALEIGCGNSNFADDLRGFVPCVHAFDYAMNVLEHKRRLGSQVELSCMDACHLPFRYNVFDLVLDKATLDSIDCCEDSVVSTAYRDIWRSVRTDGWFLSITCRPVAERLDKFRAVGDVELLVCDQLRIEGGDIGPGAPRVMLFRKTMGAVLPSPLEAQRIHARGFHSLSRPELQDVSSKLGDAKVRCKHQQAADTSKLNDEENDASEEEDDVSLSSEALQLLQELLQSRGLEANGDDYQSIRAQLICDTNNNDN